MSTGAGAYPAAALFLAGSGVRPAFAARALARIESQHEALGDAYKSAALASLVREVEEEVLDMAAWCALLATRTQQQDAATAVDVRRRALLAAITQRAGEADVLVAELRRLTEAAVS